MDSELEIIDRYSAVTPVDLNGMFRELGIKYQEQPIMTGESGWIEQNGNEYTVVVNSLDPEVRRRFTAAHELAHYLLHRDIMSSSGRMNRHTDHLWGASEGRDRDGISRLHEIQANRWAARIIMPAHEIREKFAAGETVESLAKAFKVSKAAMEIRFKTLGLPV